MTPAVKSVFLDSHGLTVRDIEAYLSAALDRGGDYADLFFELRINHSISLEEQLVNVDLGLSRSLDEGNVAPVAGLSLSFVGRNDALVTQVTLVANQDHGDLVCVLDSEDLFTHIIQIIECRLSND